MILIETLLITTVHYLIKTKIPSFDGIDVCTLNGPQNVDLTAEKKQEAEEQQNKNSRAIRMGKKKSNLL